jgi:UDP-glucuronate 4-epimerase
VKILLTGGAGFIGSHLLERLVARGDRVTVVDELNDYYDPGLKRANLDLARKAGPFDFARRDICDGCADLLKVDAIVHLAARAGVRPSLADPELYQRVNVDGTLRLLEDARRAGVRRFVFASSSSVYGDGASVPFREDQGPLDPVSPYGATKLIGEYYLHVYAKLHGMRTTALRFFTVYGPRQRPDMAIVPFARRILRGEEITLFGDGSTERDYTYIDDILQGLLAALDRDEEFEIYNLGGSRTVRLSYLIEVLEKTLGKPAKIRRLAEQPGDMRRTCASIEKARTRLGYDPQVPIEEGIRRVAGWLASGM